MNELIYLPNNQAPAALFSNIGGLYLIKPSFKNVPYIGRLGQYDRKTKTFTGTLSYQTGMNGFYICRTDGEVFIPSYDVDVLGVFINAQVAK